MYDPIYICDWAVPSNFFSYLGEAVRCRVKSKKLWLSVFTLYIHPIHTNSTYFTSTHKKYILVLWVQIHILYIHIHIYEYTHISTYVGVHTGIHSRSTIDKVAGTYRVQWVQRVSGIMSTITLSTSRILCMSTSARHPQDTQMYIFLSLTLLARTHVIWFSP